MVQNAVALLCNLSADTVLDLEPLYQQGTVCLNIAVYVWMFSASVHFSLLL